MGSCPYLSLTFIPSCEYTSIYLILKCKKSFINIKGIVIANLKQIVVRCFGFIREQKCKSEAGYGHNCHNQSYCSSLFDRKVTFISQNGLTIFQLIIFPFHTSMHDNKTSQQENVICCVTSSDHFSWNKKVLLSSKMGDRLRKVCCLKTCHKSFVLIYLDR